MENANGFRVSRRANGRWYVEKDDGRTVAGPFTHEAEAEADAADRAMKPHPAPAAAGVGERVGETVREWVTVPAGEGRSRGE